MEESRRTPAVERAVDVGRRSGGTGAIIRAARGRRGWATLFGMLMLLGGVSLVSAPSASADIWVAPSDISVPRYQRGIIFGDYSWCYLAPTTATVYLTWYSGGSWKKIGSSKTVQAWCPSHATGSVSVACQSGKHSYRMNLRYVPAQTNDFAHEETKSLTITC